MNRMMKLLVGGLLLSWGGIQPAVIANDESLNVLLIMADDIGFECFSSYGSQEYNTPRIDALAAQGIRFTNAHSTPLCTPTRVNLMSGKSNVFNYQDFGIYPRGEPTFANHFKEHGYRTAVAGKWQLQSMQPGQDRGSRPARQDSTLTACGTFPAGCASGTVPLVVNLPGRVAPGQVNEDLIACSDFFPTIVQAAGLPAKEVRNGDGWSFPSGSLDPVPQAARKKLQGALNAYPKQGQAVKHEKVSNERKSASEKRSNY